MDRLGQYRNSKLKRVCLRDMILSLSLSLFTSALFCSRTFHVLRQQVTTWRFLFNSIKSAHQMAINCVNPKPDPHDPERRDVLAHEHPYLTLPPRNLALFQHPFHFHNSRPENLSLSLSLSLISRPSFTCLYQGGRVSCQLQLREVSYAVRPGLKLQRHRHPDHPCTIISTQLNSTEGLRHVI